MPVNQKIMKALKKEYGAKAAKNVYYGMEAKGKIPKQKPKKKAKK